MRFRGLALALLASGLAACASLQLPAARTSEVSNEAFSLTGRIALREQDRNLSGGIQWQHDAGSDNVLLLSPLGQGVMQISRNERGATLRTADDRTYSALDVESLAYVVTGWRIPLAGLTYWVRGVPQPGTIAEEKRDAEGRLQLLRQDGWSIEYQLYADAPNQRLPKRVVLTRPEFELKLVVDTWEQAPAAAYAPGLVGR